MSDNSNSQIIEDSPLLTSSVQNELQQDTQEQLQAEYGSGSGYYVPDYNGNSWDSATQYSPYQGGLQVQNISPSDSGANTSMSGLSAASGAMGGTWGAVGNGVGAVAGAYENASTDSGSSVLSGAASGAAAGAAFGPWGMAIGAVVGGIAGFFGSKSKKKQAKKAFENQMELATAGPRQAQANYLQKEGLLQTAMSNYKGIQPYQQTNALLGGHKYTPNLPSNPNLPNFNVAPPDIAKGQTNTTSPPLATVNGQVPQPTGGQPGLVAPQMPSYTGHKAQDQAAGNQYAQAYADYLKNSDQALRDNMLNNYSGIQGYNQYG